MIIPDRAIVQLVYERNAREITDSLPKVRFSARRYRLEKPQLYFHRVKNTDKGEQHQLAQVTMMR